MKYFFVFFCFFLTLNAYSEISIKYKIGNEIITNVDILNEQKLLLFLRPDLKKLNSTEIKELSKNSLIKEIIKKKELKKYFDLEKKYNFIDELRINLYNFKNIKNDKQFEELIKNENIEEKNLIDKLKIEALWNELIYNKFYNLVKIDRDYLKKQLEKKISSDLKFSYNLSEILFELNQNETEDKKFKLIKNNINKNGFEYSASKFSISNSSSNGGSIGWVKETLLSKEINNVIKNISVGDFSKPIKYPNGYLILKVNEKKIIKEKIDINKELQEFIKFEKNKQLNQFSLLFFRKIKQNQSIYEY